MNTITSTGNSRRHLSLVIAICAFALAVGSGPTNACTCLIVGKKKSATGRVIVGHAEDFGGNTAQRMFRVEAATHQPGDMYRSYVGMEIPQPAETFSYIGCKAFDRDSVLGDLSTGINQHFVAVVQNEAWTRDISRDVDLKTLTKGGILFDDLTRLALERARTAREGVRIIGEMSEKYGLAHDPGAIYGVGDPNEGWWVEVVPDGQWLAVRVPDDCAEMRANCFRFGVVNLDDSENVMHSKDLVDYAVKKGWYDPAKDGPFNFSKVYGHPESLEAHSNQLRHKMSEQMLGGDKLMGISDALGFVRSTYEGLEGRKVDPVTGSPFRTGDRTISSMYTEMGFVADLDNTMPAEIGVCGWWAISCPATGVFIPWHLGNTKFPEAYQIGTDVYDSQSAYWKFVEIARLTDWKFNLLYPMTLSTWKEFENKELAEEAQARSKAYELWKNNGSAAATDYLTEYSNTKAVEALRMADELLAKMKTKAFYETD